MKRQPTNDSNVIRTSSLKVPKFDLDEMEDSNQNNDI